MTPEERIRQARENPAPYEDRYVALVDVLGWSEIVARSVTDPSVLPHVAEAAELIGYAREWADNANTISRDFSPRHGGPLELDVRASHFSDHFVFSLPISSTAEVGLMGMVGQLCINLLDRGHYTRGAIVRGLVRHTPSVLYGPAVIEAHKIESCVAKYPRVVLTPEATAAFESEWGLRKDFDGLTHLDYLRPYKATVETVAWLEGLRATVDRRAEKDAARLDLLSKHWWFRGYVDEVLARARAEVTV
jgi:hypothetical protein